MFLPLTPRRLCSRLLAIFMATALFACEGESSNNITQENLQVEDAVVQTDADGTQVQCTEGGSVIIDGVDVCPPDDE